MVNWKNFYGNRNNSSVKADLVMSNFAYEKAAKDTMEELNTETVDSPDSDQFV